MKIKVWDNSLLLTLEKRGSSEERGESFLDTNGFCFLCLSKLIPTPELPSPPLKKTRLQTVPKASIKSFQPISNYLDLDMKNILMKEDVADRIPSGFVPAYFESQRQFKAPVCEECATLVDFTYESLPPSKGMERLNRMGLEVISGVNAIYRKIATSKSDGVLQPKEEGLLPCSNMNKIREEIMQKCRAKFLNTLPEVKLDRMTAKPPKPEAIASPSSSPTTSSSESASASISNPADASDQVINPVKIKLEGQDGHISVKMEKSESKTLACESKDKTQSQSAQSETTQMPISTTNCKPGTSQSSTNILVSPPPDTHNSFRDSQHVFGSSSTSPQEPSLGMPTITQFCSVCKIIHYQFFGLDYDY